MEKTGNILHRNQFAIWWRECMILSVQLSKFLTLPVAVEECWWHWQVNRFTKLYGVDVDANCARMAVINLCLNGMFGEIAWMNSVTNQYFGGWVIVRTIKGIPRIQEISERESYIHLKWIFESDLLIFSNKTRFFLHRKAMEEKLSEVKWNQDVARRFSI